MKPVNEEIICAGHGGQGIIVMGKFLAHASMNAGYNVTWIPSYGAEVRGGTAHSMVRIQAKEKISNPLVINPTICVIMNKPSLSKFMSRIKPEGLLLADSSQVDSIPALKSVVVKKAPFTGMAIDLGNKKVANMIAIGALNKIKGLFPMKELVKCISQMLTNRRDLIDINEKALKAGYDLDFN